MIYDVDFREAAQRAETGVKRAIRSLRDKKVKREQNLSGVLKGNVDAEVEGKIGDIEWDCTILDHSSGRSAEEYEFGADLLIDVKFSGKHLKYDTPLRSILFAAGIFRSRLNPASQGQAA